MGERRSGASNEIAGSPRLRYLGSGTFENGNSGALDSSRRKIGFIPNYTVGGGLSGG